MHVYVMQRQLYKSASLSNATQWQRACSRCRLEKLSRRLQCRQHVLQTNVCCFRSGSAPPTNSLAAMRGSNCSVSTATGAEDGAKEERTRASGDASFHMSTYVCLVLQNSGPLVYLTQFCPCRRSNKYRPCLMLFFHRLPLISHFHLPPSKASAGIHEPSRPYVRRTLCNSPGSTHCSAEVHSLYYSHKAFHITVPVSVYSLRTFSFAFRFLTLFGVFLAVGER
jgi:hypothetical protein